jgi:adenosylhomocysteine nucleosidase
MTLAIVAAMHEELHALLPLLASAHPTRIAGRLFHQGRLHGHDVVLVLSGIGKVASATTATLLIQAFRVRAMVFTGTAGGLGAGVNVGDVVLARELLQHDMDASPLFPRFEVPLTGLSRFATDRVLSDAVAAAARRCLDDATTRVGTVHLAAFGVTRPRLHEGLMVSGDRFVATSAESGKLRAELPDALAVEMEGAAVAQVCADFGLPLAVLRTVSDRADDLAHVDFGRFIAEVASVYTRAIVGDWLAATGPAP